ncbi:MAG: large-conductance mechanosensitive channel protein MscL [Bacteroidetes bacterium]|nr:large-conductance mechanosensitive channel protein MscL [Bacteroidota bacterium]
MGMMKEFKEFASKGSVVDLAVGVIIGGAFGKIVSSLVEDVIMPPIGILLSGIDFSKLAVTLKAASGDQPAVLLKYGAFLNTVINFVIVAFCIFLMIKAMNTMRKKQEAAPAPPAAPTPEVALLTEIRDALRSK